MFLIFGMSPRERILTIVAFTCAFCGQHTNQDVYERSNKFSLFFIPLFSVGRRRFYVSCSNCGGTTELTEDQANNALAWSAARNQPSAG
ncbi:MAG: zinc-ribbon protein [Naasia sp.]|nr:zinc-ribbon protein [Naasia sp.]